jgi:FkbM family methyltransferase
MSDGGGEPATPLRYRWTVMPSTLTYRIGSALVGRLGEWLAEPRPVGLYPGWHYFVGERSLSAFGKLRYRLWKLGRQREGPPYRLEIPWYNGLRIFSYLGNDTSRCLFVDGCIEPNEFAYLDSILRDGMVCVDVGANEGLFTLFMARKVGPNGRVVALEPSSREFERLIANVRLNALANVEVLKIAGSDRDGDAELKIAVEEHAGHNTMREFAYQDVLEHDREKVRTRSLDGLLNESGITHVDFIKIDVEGMESNVVRGSSRVLRESRPVVLVEVQGESWRDDGRGGATVVGRLENLGYVIHVIDGESGILRRFAPGDETNRNVIAIHPGSRLDARERTQ